MRFVFNLLLMIAIALGVGFGLSYFALTHGQTLAAINVGPWAAMPDIGAPDPNPYTRAFLARSGTLQLGRSEGIQFIAETDSDGQVLDRACRYRLSGNTPTATLWTLVAVDEAGTNIAAPGTPLDLQSSRVTRSNDGQLQISVSRTLAPYDWLEIAGDGPFRLMLTLYDASLLSGIEANGDSLPAIRREACS